MERPARLDFKVGDIVYLDEVKIRKYSDFTGIESELLRQSKRLGLCRITNDDGGMFKLVSINNPDQEDNAPITDCAYTSCLSLGLNLKVNRTYNYNKFKSLLESL